MFYPKCTGYLPITADTGTVTPVTVNGHRDNISGFPAHDQFFRYPNGCNSRHSAGYQQRIHRCLSVSILRGQSDGDGRLALLHRAESAGKDGHGLRIGPDGHGGRRISRLATQDCDSAASPAASATSAAASPSSPAVESRIQVDCGSSNAAEILLAVSAVACGGGGGGGPDLLHHGHGHSARGGWGRLHAEDAAPAGAHPASPTTGSRRPTEPATAGPAERGSSSGAAREASSHCSSATAASAPTTAGHHQRTAGDDLGAAATEAGNSAAAAEAGNSVVAAAATSGDSAGGTSSTTTAAATAATSFRTSTAAATRATVNIRERRRKSDQGTAAQNRGITERPREFTESVGRTGAHPDAAAVAAQRGKQQPQHALWSGLIPGLFHIKWWDILHLRVENLFCKGG